MIIMAKLVLSIMIINAMPQFGAYLTIIIYDCKTFIVQATGSASANIITNDNFMEKDVSS